MKSTKAILQILTLFLLLVGLYIKSSFKSEDSELLAKLVLNKLTCPIACYILY